jgi:hypothetical protein
MKLASASMMNTLGVCNISTTEAMLCCTTLGSDSAFNSAYPPDRATWDPDSVCSTTSLLCSLSWTELWWHP